MILFSLSIQIGHLHPLLVHLPIGILTLAIVLELYAYRKPSDIATEMITLTLAAAALSALVSLGSGWLLGEDGGYDETLLFRHRWMAVALTLCSIALFFFKKSKLPLLKKGYLPLFIATLALLGITGHIGGSMTHGEDYIFQEAEPQALVITDANKAQLYQEIVQPIFNAKCVSCHNVQKAKGGLLMTNTETLLKGGDSGKILDSISDSEPALLLQRMRLPLEDKEHMPPKGKVQLTSDEILLLEWWMENNHCFDCIAGDLEKNKKIDKALKGLEKDTSLRALIAEKVDPVSQEWLLELQQNGVSIYPIAETSPLLIVNMAGLKNLKKELFAPLKKYAGNIVELNLSHSNFDDELSPVLPNFENITKLQLQHTAITDKSIVALKGLKSLESLNVYHTAVSDVSLSQIEQMQHLKNLYLWQTNVSTAGLSKLQQKQTDLWIQGAISDSIFPESTLEPPTILADTEFFGDTLTVHVEGVFDNAKLYYTLDGTIPDTNSLLYSKPLVLDKSTNLNVISYLEGWKQSEIRHAQFRKNSIEVSKVSLHNNPHKNYTAQQGNTLIDLTRGSLDFSDGHWLGYQGSHFTTTFQLSQEKEVSSVSVGALSAPGSWIFFPSGIRIWTSLDGKKYHETAAVQYPATENTFVVERSFFDVAIEPVKTKYVKVQVRSPLRNPSWHPAAGKACYIFIDEIVIN
ncbi:FN3 associated domain-containing protein [Spongiimicrobium salis]|uniref:FN3 associated domain-containing protein n=1 Tax=Spongiimicrobium salis TaxID=1667022 RepID=UPI00374CA54C